MDWLSDDPHRGQIVLIWIAVGIAAVLIWLLRRKLAIAIFSGLAFLLFAMTAIPDFIPARNVAYRNACINNLKQIKEAKERWARENHKLPADIPTEEDLYGVNGTNGFLRHKLICPSGGKYDFGAVNENPTCSLTDKGHTL